MGVGRRSFCFFFCRQKKTHTQTNHFFCFTKATVFFIMKVDSFYFILPKGDGLWGQPDKGK